MIETTEATCPMSEESSDAAGSGDSAPSPDWSTDSAGSGAASGVRLPNSGPVSPEVVGSKASAPVRGMLAPGSRRGSRLSSDGRPGVGSLDEAATAAAAAPGDGCRGGELGLARDGVLAGSLVRGLRLGSSSLLGGLRLGGGGLPGSLVGRLLRTAEAEAQAPTPGRLGVGRVVRREHRGCGGNGDRSGRRRALGRGLADRRRGRRERRSGAAREGWTAGAGRWPSCRHRGSSPG